MSLDGLVERLYGAYEDAVLSDADTAHAALRDADLDPDSLESEGLQFVRAMQRRQVLLRAKSALAEVKRCLSVGMPFTGEPGTLLRDRLAEVLGITEGPTLQLCFRKLEQMTEEDALTLEDDAALLRWLDENLPQIP